MTRKEKHRLLAKLAGVPWQFHCPECDGHWFGSSMESIGSKVMLRHCHDEFRGRCHWSGSSEACRLTPDYDKDHNAWIVIHLALDGKCLWDEFFDAWVEIDGPFHRSVADATYRFINDLPGQVDAAIEVMR